MKPDVICFAEDIPFADGSFDVVVTRIAPHHFADVERAVQEMARVSNRLVVIEDSLYTSPEVEAAEKLRDPTHVRNLSESEWRGLLEDAGLEVDHVEHFAKTHPLDDWLARTDCVGDDAERVRELLADVTDEDGSAWHDTKIIIRAVKARFVMAIIVDSDTRLVVAGLTGSEGRFHGLRNRAYGTNVVAGVTPGKGGQDVEGVPVYDTVADAVSEAGANTSMIFVPARFAPDAIYEAVDAGIKTVICITEHIPAHEMLRVYTYVRPKGVTLIGPNCPGVLSPGKANVGIIPAEVFKAGSIGLVSRSGTLTYQIGYEVAQRGLGNSSIVGIGGDPVVGSSFIDILEKFEADPETEVRRARRRDRRRRGREGGGLRLGAHDEAGLLVHRRVLGPSRQDDGARRRDHLRLVRHGGGQEGRARGGRDQGRHDADRGRRARRRRRVLVRFRPARAAVRA